MARRARVYKPINDQTTPKQMRERLAKLDPESRADVEREAKSLVDAMHKNGARAFGIVSSYELLEKLYKLDKAVKLGLQPDLRKKRTLIGLAESVKDEPS